MTCRRTPASLSASARASAPAGRPSPAAATGSPGRQASTRPRALGAPESGDPKSEPRLVALTPVPFASQLPAVVEPPFIELRKEALKDYPGEYDFGKEARIRMFERRGRLFMFLPGEGEGELFAVAKDTVTIRAVAGVKIVFNREQAGAVSDFSAQRLRASRREPFPEPGAQTARRRERAAYGAERFS